MLDKPTKKYQRVLVRLVVACNGTIIELMLVAEVLDS
jgi:hypothetical protein